MKNQIIIGTRGSNLALIQANMVKNSLIEIDHTIDVRLEIIKTKGDKILDSPLSKIGDKGLFTKELEEALYNGKIHMAVHSLKDLPTELPEGIIIGGVLEREDVRDAFISRDRRKLSEMQEGDVIATSSLRRSSQLRKINPALTIIDIRGNIETRMKKMKEGYCDATLLACAGLIRGGYIDMITEALDPEVFLPAVSQGIIGIEILQSNTKILETLKKIHHRKTGIMANAERAFLRRLQGGCQVPVACYSRIEEELFYFTGMVSDLSGKNQLKTFRKGEISRAVYMAIETAEEIISLGGDKILKNIKHESDKHEREQ
ncbi:MAG: hydroxymethylbilane synthase [Spirochaetales bacterium]|nr:hydroxymethylbilane synthase [Spirochaetales bacterium]